MPKSALALMLEAAVEKASAGSSSSEPPQEPEPPSDSTSTRVPPRVPADAPGWGKASPTRGITAGVGMGSLEATALGCTAVRGRDLRCGALRGLTRPKRSREQAVLRLAGERRAGGAESTRRTRCPDSPILLVSGLSQKFAPTSSMPPPLLTSPDATDAGRREPPAPWETERAPRLRVRLAGPGETTATGAMPSALRAAGRLRLPAFGDAAGKDQEPGSSS